MFKKNKLIRSSRQTQSQTQNHFNFNFKFNILKITGVGDQETEEYLY